MTYGSKDLFDMTFCLSGYSEKAPLLLKEFIQSLTTPRINVEIFEKQKTLLKNRYYQSTWDQKDSPLKQAKRMMQEELHLYPPFTEKIKTLETITFNDLADFAEFFFDKTYLESMLVGNISKQEACSVWEYATQALSLHPYPKQEHKHNKLILPSQRNGPRIISQTTSAYGNAAIVILEHPSFSFARATSILVLSQALHQTYFDVMRTKKQIAYSVSVNTWKEQGAYLSAFMIQSSLLKSFSSSPNNLTDMAKTLDRLSFDQQGDFMQTEKHIAALENLTYDEVYLYAKTYFSCENQNRFAIALEGPSLNH